jgi:hypothetical protein
VAVALVCAALVAPVLVAPALGHSLAQAQGDGYTPVYAIQGSGPASPRQRDTVTVRGVVTGVTATGFFLQDPLGDGDPATSDGIFVYTASRPDVAAGQCVVVGRARVEEFYAKTELNRVAAIQPATGCATPAANPAALPMTGLEQSSVQRWEAFEGMLVHLPPLAMVVLGPARAYAGGEVELAVAPAAWLTYLDTPRLFHDQPAAQSALLHVSNRLGATVPPAATGVRLAWPPIGLTGVLDYNFGKYQLLPLPGQLLWLQGDMPVARPQPAPLRDDEFGVCSANLHGLGRGAAQYADAGEYARALDRHAQFIATTLRDCTVIALQETGTPDDAAALARALAAYGLGFTATALPGPASADSAFPLTNSLLTRDDRVAVEEAALLQGCAATDYAIEDAGACPAGQYPLFDRPPLMVRLTVDGAWEGGPRLLWIVNNHWKSKAGDEAVNAGQRMAQARHVAAGVASIQAQAPDAPVVVIGDLNDFYAAPPIEALRTGVTPAMVHVYDYLPALDRYTYIFNGAAQVLDHVLVSAGLAQEVAAVEIAHVHADYPGTGPAPALSDHDPVLLRLRPGGAAIAGGNLQFAGIEVEARAADGRVLATGVTDAAGEYRLWGLPVGRVDLRYVASPAVIVEPTAQSEELVAGFQMLAAPRVHHRTALAAAALAVSTPDLAVRSIATDRRLNP